MAYYHNKDEVDDIHLDGFKFTTDGFNKFREEYYQKIKKEQETFANAIRERERHQLASEPRKFPERIFVWSDTDTRFEYLQSDVPILDIRGRIKVCVTKFEEIDDITCQLLTREAKHFRGIIDKELHEYCTATEYDKTFWPAHNEIFFLYAAPLKIPNIPKPNIEFPSDSGGTWTPGWLAEDSDNDEQNDEDGDLKDVVKSDTKLEPLWIRAEFLELSKNKSTMTVRLIDFGQTITYSTTSRKYMRKAVLRCVPALSITASVVLDKPTQYTSAVSEKWKKLMPCGTKLLLELCCGCGNGKYLTRLVSPTEEELDLVYIYKRLHGGERKTKKVRPEGGVKLGTFGIPAHRRKSTKAFNAAMAGFDVCYYDDGEEEAKNTPNVHGKDVRQNVANCSVDFAKKEQKSLKKQGQEDADPEENMQSVEVGPDQSSEEDEGHENEINHERENGVDEEYEEPAENEDASYTEYEPLESYSEATESTDTEEYSKDSDEAGHGGFYLGERDDDDLDNASLEVYYEHKPCP